MAELKEQKLFAEFAPVTTEQWEAVINADLKGADYQKKLVWKTMEGFSVKPYYRAENLTDIKHIGTAPGEFPFVRGIKQDNNWLVRQTINVNCPDEANKLALDALNRGVDSLCFKINKKEFTSADLDTLLKDISIDAIEINFEACLSSIASIAKYFISKVEALNLSAESVNASFNIDPLIKKLSLKGIECDSKLNEIADLVKIAEKYFRIRFVTVNGDIFDNCGATIVESVAFTLAAGHDYIVKLMEAGLSIDKAAHTIKFNMAVGSNYFMEIAKFRAIRMLWANIIKQYNPSKCCTPKMKIHAVTSKFNMTAYDPYVNMLRGTTEAMSAAIAGVSSIEVVPFDNVFAESSEFSSRIARNTQLLLKEESHFNQVTDASGGSYYIENLTASIAECAWKLFKEVEENGGYSKAIKSEFIQNKIEATANNRIKNIACRKEILLGTNQYPNFTEVADAKVTETDVYPKVSKCCCNKEGKIKTLLPLRGAMPFEELRLKVDRSGKNPIAFMLTFGSLSFCRARAQFASNFFACAGIKIVDNTRFATIEEGIKAAKEANADIVVICSSDEEYADAAPVIYDALKDDALVVVAGDPACRPELEAKGVKNYISVRSNVLETLQGYIKELGL